MPLGTVATTYGRYMDQKRRRRLVDFDDILRLAARDLEADPVYAAARRWRFRHLFVDEFQDVNPLQYHLLQQWLGPESDVCIVGDPNQAIYAWNGADARYLVDFDRFFPGGDSVVLADNCRSTPQILAVANAVLQQGANVAIRLRPHRSVGDVPTVTAPDHDEAEARAVARRCRDSHRPGVPWSAQAVLVRTNAQTTLLAEAMSNAGVPHRVRGAGRLLEQPEVTEALQVLRRAATLEVGLADLDHDVLHSDRLTEERAANVAEIVRLGREHMALVPDGDIRAFIAWLTTTLRDEDRGGGDAVDIVTFHAAKGLEWPIVHLAGLEEGYVPIHHAETQDDLDEERRLLYVALTRARDELHCSWSRKRTFGSRTMNRSPSPWLDAIETTLGVAPTQVSRARGAERARAARKSVPKTGTPAPGAERALFDALKAWRREQSRAADVPAFVIFNDATLTAIAQRRPTTSAQLLGVSGVGPVKAQRFGADVLRIVAETPT